MLESKLTTAQITSVTEVDMTAIVGHRKALKAEGMLTRDSRAKERKKYGMAGARKRFQFSKR